MTSDFWSLPVVQRVHEATLLLYRVTAGFPPEERFRVVDQLCRAAVSVSGNIVESMGRYERTDQVRLLRIARGSAHEVEYLVRLSRDLGYLQGGAHRELDDAFSEILRMVNGMIRYRGDMMDRHAR